MYKGSKANIKMANSGVAQSGLPKITSTIKVKHFKNGFL
jgi:hypothetical protein